MNRTKNMTTVKKDVIIFDSNSFLDSIIKFKNEGKHELAIFIAVNMLKCDITTDIKTKLLAEIGISAFYTSRKELGIMALDHLLLNGGVWYNILSNIGFYAQKIKRVKKIKLSVKAPMVEHTNQLYRPMNPSILRYKNGWISICRLVNYTQKGAKNFKFISPDGVCRTKQVLTILDNDFNNISQIIMEDISGRPRYEGARVLYFEDAVPFFDENQLYMLSNALDGSTAGISEMFKCKIDIETGSIVSAIPLSSFQSGRSEKNWLPIEVKGELNYLYSYNPVVILDKNLRRTETVQDKNFTSFRGGGGACEFKINNRDGYLVVVHEVGIDGHGRCYLHRFVWMNSDFKIKYLSHPWCFEHRGIEYCRSMVLDNGQAILGVGIEDREAWFYIIDVEEIMSMMKPLEEFEW